MNIDFQQGIISYPTKNGRQSFLSRNGQYVSLLTTDGDTSITFAHGFANYLYTESSDVNTAWGPLLTGTDYWLYWDLNTLTGIRTFGFTNVQPTFSIESQRPTGALDLHWFNTTNKKMYVYQADGWREVIRVFAARVRDNVFTPIADNRSAYPFAGTQVGLKDFRVVTDHIAFDSTNLPIRRLDGLFYTVHDIDSVGISNPITPTRLEAAILTGVSTTSIPAFQVVKFTEAGKVSLASYNDIQDTMLSINLTSGTDHTLCSQGVITNAGWNFTQVGQNLWITNIGTLTAVDPNISDPVNYPLSKTPVARTITPTSLLFDVGMGGPGSEGEKGQAAGPSTTTSYGIARLSLPATNPANPIVVGDNDPRLIPYAHPATHPATMITTAAYSFLTGATAQLQLQQLADRTLDSLGDVTAPSATVGQGLKWNGTQWINSSFPALQYLNDFLDVTLTSPVGGQILKYNGTQWVNVNKTLTLTTDVTGSGNQGANGVTNIATTLATVNSNIGTFGSNTLSTRLTLNEKGLTTAAQQVAIASPGGAGTVTSVDMAPNLNKLPGTSAGTLWGWGSNSSGQLGLNDINDRSSPTQVGTLSTWSSVAQGYEHTMLVKSDGTLWATGRNGSGQLGLGNIIWQSSPTQIGALTNWKQPACGYNHTAVTKTDGTLWAWGFNNNGQLGDGTNSNNKSSPIQIGSLTDWEYVACGYATTHGIKTDGSLWAWGWNFSGQLGTGNIISRSSPVQVGALTNWKQVTSGESSTLAVKTDGTLWAWGGNISGMCGLGDTISRSSPTQVGALTNWTQVQSKAYSTYAIKTDGTLWAWGNNQNGELGLGDTINRSSPVQVGSLTNWARVAVCGYGSINSYAIKTDGTLWAWGNNTLGQLGNNGFTSTSSPVQIGSLTDWLTVSCGYQAVSAIRGTVYTGERDILFSGGPVTTGDGLFYMDGTLSIANGGTSAKDANTAMNNLAPAQATFGKGPYPDTLWMCGYGVWQLPSAIDPTVFTILKIAKRESYDWKMVSNGYSRTVAIKNDGTLWSCGYGVQGALGFGQSEQYVFEPRRLSTFGDWNAIWTDAVCAAYNTLAIKADGTLWSVGDNGNGELGISSAGRRQSLVQVGALTDWRSVNGFYHILATKTDGTLWGWGYNGSGRVGDGTTLTKSSPVQIGNLTDWDKIACGYSHSHAIKFDGTLWAWGDNYYGQFGDGTTIGTSSPVQVGSLTNWAQISCGYDHVAAIKTDGTLWAWGNNYYGQLGQGDNIRRSSPIQVGSLTTWKQVTCTEGATLALKTDGTLWICGSNGNAQQGDGYLPTTTSFIQSTSITNWKSLAKNVIHFTFAAIRELHYEDKDSFLYTDGVNTHWSRLINPNLQHAQGMGWNGSGQLGLGHTTPQSSPVHIGIASSDWKQIAAGYRNFAGIKRDGTLWACGYNQYGMVGNGTFINVSSLVQIGTGTDWSYVACGYTNTAAIKNDGTLWVWGYNNNGEVGDGTTVHRSSPVQVGSLTDWKYVDCGDSQMAAVKTDGTLWNWGFVIASGFLRYSSPVQVGALTDWANVWLGEDHMMMLKMDNTLWGWGDGLALGAGTASYISSPIQIGSLMDWTSVVSTGFIHTAAIKNDGTLWSAGYNSYGAVGDGTQVHRSSFIQIGTDNDWKDVAAGYFTTVALKTDGSLWGWGRNTGGQLGINVPPNGVVTSPILLTTSPTWNSVVSRGENWYALENENPLVGIIQGGTGQRTTSDITANLFPNQSTQANKALTFNGSTIRWATSSGN